MTWTLLQGSLNSQGKGALWHAGGKRKVTSDASPSSTMGALPCATVSNMWLETLWGGGQIQVSTISFNKEAARVSNYMTPWNTENDEQLQITLKEQPHIWDYMFILDRWFPTGGNAPASQILEYNPWEGSWPQNDILIMVLITKPTNVHVSMASWCLCDIFP